MTSPLTQKSIIQILLVYLRIDLSKDKDEKITNIDHSHQNASNLGHLKYNQFFDKFCLSLFICIVLYFYLYFYCKIDAERSIKIFNKKVSFN